MLVKFVSKGWLFIIFLILTSCASSPKLKKEFLYFQNDADNTAVRLREPFIQANDMLSIQIISKSVNQEQTRIFSASTGNGSDNAGGAQYLVSLAGNIEMPIIGTIKAEGLTKVQLETVISEKLAPYVKDPSVFIRYLPFSINILGEVKTPGKHSFAPDRVTILDAIGSAGDLTDFGKREDVLVIREESGRRKYYTVDLRSKALFQSPVYQLQANDIVYVGANDIKLKTLHVNPTSQRNWQFLFGVISLVSTFTSIVFALTR